VLGIFRKSKSVNNPIKVDIHSHLLPGLDDGVSSFEESLEIILKFEEAGYQKLVTTPHIMSDFYKNTPDIINGKLQELKSFIESQTSMIVEAAAEYYLDENFLELIDSDEKLLTFGSNYVLFELSFMSKPLTIKDAVFNLQTKGYKPVLAHAERYLYYHESINELEEIYHTGVLLQLNILSLAGYYSKQVKRMAKKLLGAKMISFIGSDCHNGQQLISFKEVLNSAHLNVLLDQNILNQQL